MERGVFLILHWQGLELETSWLCYHIEFMLQPVTPKVMERGGQYISIYLLFYLRFVEIPGCANLVIFWTTAKSRIIPVKPKFNLLTISECWIQYKKQAFQSDKWPILLAYARHKS